MKRTYQPSVTKRKPAVVAQYWQPVAPKAANAWLYNFELRLLEAVSLIKNG